MGPRGTIPLDVSQVDYETPPKNEQAEELRQAHVEPHQLEAGLAMWQVAPRRAYRQVASIRGVGQGGS